MTIESDPFGGVTLTGEDARKFRRQIRYGRPKKVAIDAVRRGIELARELAERGIIKLRLRESEPKKPLPEPPQLESK